MIKQIQFAACILGVSAISLVGINLAIVFGAYHPSLSIIMAVLLISLATSVNRLDHLNPPEVKDEPPGDIAITLACIAVGLVTPLLYRAYIIRGDQPLRFILLLECVYVICRVFVKLFKWMTKKPS